MRSGPRRGICLGGIVPIADRQRELYLCEAANDRRGVANACRKLGERETERQRFTIFGYVNQ